MNAELKQKWVEALRSGKYPQGAIYLRSAKDCFCCIGVLVDVSGYQWPPPLNGAYTFGQECTTLSPAQQEQFGISYDTTCELISMNDGARQFSFAQIADWIEANIEPTTERTA
jgi:hypothetical protein